MHRRRFILGTATLIAAVVGLMLLRHLDWASANSNVKLSQTAAGAYDPARYGLPSTIGGYQVLAVLTSDNNACMLPGEKVLVLEATQQSVEEYLRTSNIPDIKTELRQKGFPDFAQSGPQIVGPGTKLDEFLSEVKKSNAFAQQYGCVTSGPAPTPDTTP
jgi:hypothetical protein